MLPKIEHPLTKISIPSTKKEITVRPMLVKDEKLLLIAKTSGLYGDILASVKQVVNNCVVEKGFDINKLALFDLEYIFIKLRAISINNISKVSYKDGEDQKVYDFNVDLEKVDIKYPDKEINNVIKVNDAYSIVMKYPEASLYADKDFLRDVTNVDKIADHLIMYTVDKIVNGDKMIQPELESKEEVIKFIDNLQVKTYEEIKSFWNNMPKLNYVIEYKNSLGNERKVILSTLEDFFTLL